MKRKVELVPTATAPSHRVEHDDTPKIGEWFMVKGEKGKKEWLACVVEHGSNYFGLRGVFGETARVHLSEFWAECRRSTDTDAHIDEQIALHRNEMQRLIREVHALTARLHVAPMRELRDDQETKALSVQHGTGPIKEYKKALVKAQEKDLPKLFEQIEKASEKMGDWMKAKLIPLRAEAEIMKGTIEAVEDRIFSVELYAGLVEEIARIREGAPAADADPLHLFQRRHYMDEECLAAYETGGMEFKDIGAFDRWLCRKANLDRILPFPRCVAAFQVRRKTKERESVSLRGFLSVLAAEAADKKTFLYLRNGDQVYRLSTKIEFEEQLFPDLDRTLLDRGKLWARIFAGRVDEIIPDTEYQGMLEEEAKKRRKAKSVPEKDRWKYEDHWPRSRDYIAYEPKSVYYDDVTRYIQKDIKAHNRIVLVLQGLLDRSPAFHPHPPWQLWTPEGFAAALVLHHDDSRALTAGDAPDFEAYRAELNKSLADGSVTVGQEDAWQRREAEKYNEQMSRRHPNRDWECTHYHPPGDPGPGRLSTVEKFRPRAETCSYVWARERRTYRRYAPDTDLRSRIVVSTKHLINADAYKPGDFHRFFDDPRTRAQYLQWAPLLLEAEEYQAGNRSLKRGRSDKQDVEFEPEDDDEAAETGVEFDSEDDDDDEA